AVRIDIAVEFPPGRDVVHQLDAGDLNDAMPLIRVEPGRFGVYDDLAHLRLDTPAAMYPHRISLRIRPASFDTRCSFAAALLRMRISVGWHQQRAHPERERSEQSKDAQQTIQPRTPGATLASPPHKCPAVPAGTLSI